MSAEDNGSGRADRPFVVFISGITPAEIIYEPLLGVVGDEVRSYLKDLEVFAEDAAPEFTFDVEVEAIKRVADEARKESVHLVGLSAGATAALAFAVRYPERATSLALIEPPRTTDAGWTSEDAEYWEESDEVILLPPAERMGRFPRLVLAPGVEPPPRPSGSPPPWAIRRAVGMAPLGRALRALDLDTQRLRSFRKPVYLALGTLSNPVYRREEKRLKATLPDLEVEIYEGSHHLYAPHLAEPERFARALRQLWTRAATRA